MALRRVPAGGSAAVTVGRPSGVAAPTIVADAVERHASDEAPLSTAALIKEAIDTALESVDTLEHQARDTARRFRRGARAEAQLGLTHLMQSMQTLLRLAAMAAGASGTDLETFCERHELRAEGQTQIAVSELIRRQLAEDWSGLAATLDRSFSAALEGWRRVFIALGGTPTGPYGHAA